MPFSKYDPHRPLEEEREATTESGQRRVWALRWGWRISQAMWAIGAILILYWIWRGRAA